MARKEEIGIKYFPVNSDIIHNKKIKLVIADFGPIAWAILMPLYCKIYRDMGYWIDWYDEDSKILFANDECKQSLAEVESVVSGCLRRGLFDQKIFDNYGILTNDRIQLNFFEAKSRSKNVIFYRQFFSEKINVDTIKENVDIIDLDVNILCKKVDTGTQNKRRIKGEGKGEYAPPGVGDPSESPHDNSVPKYSPGEKPELKYVYAYIRDHKPTIAEPYVDMWNIFAVQEKFPSIKKLNKAQSRKLITRIREPDFDLAKILARAKGSEFLQSGNWFNFHWLIKNETNYIKVLEGNYDNKKDQTDGTKIDKPKFSAAEQKGLDIIASVVGPINDDLRESAATGS